MSKALQCVFIIALFAFNSLNALASEDDHDHTGHSDDLLTLLQYKIAISKLQNSFDDLSPQEQLTSLALQHQKIKKVLPVLQNYIAIPEGRYPNMDMYQQSLQSRAALLGDFSKIVMKTHALDVSRNHKKAQ